MGNSKDEGGMGDGIGNEKPKSQLTHPDKFLDELESDPSEDPDALLTKSLPQLDKEMKQIQSDFMGLNADIESIDIDSYGELKTNTTTTKNRWKNFKKKFVSKFKELSLKAYYYLKYFILWLVLEVPKKIIKVFKLLLESFKNFGGIFFKWSIKRKALFMLSFISIISILFVYIKLIKSDFLYKEGSTFYGTMEDLAEFSFNYDRGIKQDPFYNSPRVKVYSFQLKPVIINLKRKKNLDENSTENPMAFFEFIFEGNSGDVVVELKERESEFVDLVSRVIELKTYEELETLEGKMSMKEDLRIEINKKINNGIIRKIEIRNFFIKP